MNTGNTNNTENQRISDAELTIIKTLILTLIFSEHGKHRLNEIFSFFSWISCSIKNSASSRLCVENINPYQSRCNSHSMERTCIEFGTVLKRRTSEGGTDLGWGRETYVDWHWFRIIDALSSSGKQFIFFIECTYGNIFIFVRLDCAVIVTCWYIDVCMRLWEGNKV